MRGFWVRLNLNTKTMTQEELLQAESSQRQHHEVMLHQDRQWAVVESAEYNKFALLKPKLYQDGNQWCCLYGENTKNGICGFGDSPYLAILDWNKAWHSNLSKG